MVRLQKDNKTMNRNKIQKRIMIIIENFLLASLDKEINVNKVMFLTVYLIS